MKERNQNSVFHSLRRMCFNFKFFFLAGERVKVRVPVETVGLVDEEHASSGLLERVVDLVLGLAKVRAHQVTGARLHHRVAPEHAYKRMRRAKSAI